VKMTVFWVVEPCSLVVWTFQRCLLSPSPGDRLDETSVNFYRITRRSNPKDSHFCGL
jgi:hypothetical protein